MEGLVELYQVHKLTIQKLHTYNMTLVDDEIPDFFIANNRLRNLPPKQFMEYEQAKAEIRAMMFPN